MRVAFCKVWSSFSNQRPFPATQEVPSSPQCRCHGAQLPAQHRPQLGRAKHRWELNAHGGSGGEQAGRTHGSLSAPFCWSKALQRLGACPRAHAQCRVAWPILFLLGIFSGSLPGRCCLPGCGLGHLPASPAARRQRPGRFPAEVITSCRLKIPLQFEGIFLP